MHVPGPPDPPDPRVLDALDEAAAYYRTRAPSSWAPRYLDRRGLTTALAAPWGAGHAPRSWTATGDHLRRKGFPDEVLLDAGLVFRARNGRLLDVFRDRLMLPVRRPDGRTAGFVARARDGADGPKYLNSRTGPAYRKGDLVLGLAESRGALASGAVPVLVEGPLDAVAVTAAGGGRFVGLSACGTAWTARQVDAVLAASPGRTPVVAPDADGAGALAARRLAPLLTRYGLDPGVVGLPEGSDPADVLALGGPGELVTAMESTRPLAEAVAAGILAEHGERLRWAEGCVAAAREIGRAVPGLPEPARERLAGRLAPRLDLDPGAVAGILAAPGTRAAGPGGRVRGRGSGGRSWRR